MKGSIAEVSSLLVQILLLTAMSNHSTETIMCSTCKYEVKGQYGTSCRHKDFFGGCTYDGMSPVEEDCALLFSPNMALWRKEHGEEM